MVRRSGGAAFGRNPSPKSSNALSNISARNMNTWVIRLKVQRAFIEVSFLVNAATAPHGDGSTQFVVPPPMSIVAHLAVVNEESRVRRGVQHINRSNHIHRSIYSGRPINVWLQAAIRAPALRDRRSNFTWDRYFQSGA